MIQDSIAHPPVATREEWRAERVKLLHEEKELTKQADRVNAQRRRLPMVKLEKNYTFHGANGVLSLADLFEGMRQLVVYHFMFDPSWDEGCDGCTGYVDAIGNLSMLKERQTNFMLISRAPLEKLDAYKAKKGWTCPWVSSFGSDFNYDFHATLDEKVAPVEYNYKSHEELRAEGGPEAGQGEAHGMSVFFRIDDEIYHTYSVYARGMEHCTDSYSILDLTPYGRQEDFEDSPPGWPQKPTYG
jgi:predicted dithiol-disulfide oxidoreductase (DUF899 family)